VQLLDELTLTDLLSFGPDTAPLRLAPLNVLIGPNGSGKSNLVEAVSLLRSAPAELVVPVREGGGVRDWLWKGAAKPATARLDAVVRYPAGEQALRYRLAFTEAGGRLEVTDERIENLRASPGRPKPYFYFGYEHGRPMLNVGGQTAPRTLRKEEVDAQRSILSQRKDPDQYPEVTYLGEAFARIRIFREWSFGRYTAPRLPQPADLPNDFLAEDGRNLGLVLNRLRRDPQVKLRLVEELRRLYDGIDDFETVVEGGTVQVFLQEGRWTVPATRLSDGTLRYLCLLAVLCHPAPPPLVCIEEPELGLHPDVLPHLAALLHEASTRTQLIVTTHSDILVDALTDTPDVVVVCEKHDGATRLTRLDAESVRPWLQKYRLGDLWTRGEIGGTRW
jgi:predicted ATPase